MNPAFSILDPVFISFFPFRRFAFSKVHRSKKREQDKAIIFRAEERKRLRRREKGFFLPAQDLLLLFFSFPTRWSMQSWLGSHFLRLCLSLHAYFFIHSSLSMCLTEQLWLAALFSPSQNCIAQKSYSSFSLSLPEMSMHASGCARVVPAGKQMQVFLSCANEGTIVFLFWSQ